MRDSTIATALHDNTVRVWDETTGKCVRVLLGHKNAVYGLVELSDGTLLSGSYDGTIIEWNSKGDRVSTCKLQHTITSMKEISDGSIVTGGNCGEVEVRKTWNKESKREETVGREKSVKQREEVEEKRKKVQQQMRELQENSNCVKTKQISNWRKRRCKERCSNSNDENKS
eukprot:TRINITY_DN1866_c0_g1_i3.p1 TRINITY_DN1866_c0_g1~~TRINITY_DN1866_c0_g1_i3.p1  ORF type:complete len:171 (-),score=47.15 TRINITY_DN1866_c0_g1_i3:221-733(-)